MAQAQKPQTTDPATDGGQEPQKKIVTVTMEELQALIGTASAQAAAQAVQQLKASIPPPTNGAAPATRRMTNADFMAQGNDPTRQTQEDVATLAATVGPVTHARGFVPCVPEVIAKRDMDAHANLIGRLEAMGYVVSLDRVEFRARWEPTEAKLLGDRVVRVRVFAEDGVSDPPEPEHARPLLAQLHALDAQHSRIWLTRWQRGKAVSGDRAIDELVAQEDRQGTLANIRAQELGRVETGDFGHLDNLGDAGAGMEHQALAPMER